MATMSPEVETDKNVNSSDKSTNSENKQTTLGNFSSTEVKSTLTISLNFENTKSANKPRTKAATDGDDEKEATVEREAIGEKEATGLATNHFLSIIAISIIFVPFFLNA